MPETMAISTKRCLSEVSVCDIACRLMVGRLRGVEMMP